MQASIGEYQSVSVCNRIVSMLPSSPREVTAFSSKEAPSADSPSASPSPVSVFGERAERAPSQPLCKAPRSSARILWQSAHCTSCGQCKEAMRAVVQRCGDAKLDWITPLTRACIDGRTECVRCLVAPPEEAVMSECYITKAEALWRHQWMIDFADPERHNSVAIPYSLS